MTAQDLRIGNLVKGVRIGKVKSIFITHFQVDDFNGITLGNSIQENFNPIPLTEEWLLSLGCFLHPFFTQKRYCLPKFEQCGVDLQLTVSEVGGFVLWLVNDGDTNGTALKIVRALHELQNAFHVFTGEELTLKQ